MKKILQLLFLVATIGVLPVEMFAWQGMPTPFLHVEGNKLKDPTGKDVLLHGWMQPIETWFNGGGNRYSNPSDWTNPGNVAGMLNFLCDAADVMSDTLPKYGFDHGWYASFVRINTDAIGGWTHQSGLINTDQFDGWINNFLVPYANHLKSRGLYLVVCATGPMMTPDNGEHNAGVVEQQRLRTFWSTVANAPGVKNADNIMFELMNEPVQIESSPGNGNWGSGRDIYYEAFKNWMQPIIDDIRNTGAENMVWVSCLGWQGEPHGWAQYPFSGSNVGVAAHYYPAYGGVHNNTANVQNLWDRQYKPAADLWPMLITEMMWFPGGTGYENLFNGTTAGFGNAIKKAMDNQGNVSYLVGFLGDHLVDMRQSIPADCSLGLHEGTQSYFQWLPGYTKYGPDDGTPKFKYASVTDNNPKQLNVLLVHTVNEQNNFDGFTVKADGQIVGIESIVLGDSTNQLVINLTESIQNDNDIALSYNDGNVVSAFGKDLVGFSDVLVDNLLKGASPKLTGLRANESGDTIIATFNMKMKIPSDISDLSLKVDYDGNPAISFLQGSFFKNDSASLAFTLSERVYADYMLSLSYSGNTIVSSDGGLLQTIAEFPVVNNSTGLPVQIVSGETDTEGSILFLEFSKPITFDKEQFGQFTLLANSTSIAFEDFFVLNRKTITINLTNPVHYADTLKLNYAPGDVIAEDKGALDGFDGFELANLMEQPRWVSVPRKIEAESFLLQSGTSIENTNDTGGGENVGYIDNGDWLEYAIRNTTTETEFEITFRVASPSGNGRINYYLNNKLAGNISIPNTSGWQNWQSVSKNIKIPKGKHYLKLVASVGGFNINYFEINNLTTGINEIHNDELTIFPNPISSEMIIQSQNFQYNKIEVIDILGKSVLIKAITYEPELHLPVNLLKGMYIVKFSNEKQVQFKRIIVDNNI